jgi:hypothetical protein
LNRKTLLIIGIIVAVLCICSVIAGAILLTQAGKLISQTISTDPAKIESSAQRITDYTLPEGYKETFGMDMFGVSMVGFSSVDNQQAIMLFQAPDTGEANREQLEQQMRQLGEQQMGQEYTLEKVDEVPVVIRGQETTLVIYEGTSKQGVEVRQEVAVFQGNNGLAFFMSVGPKSSWDTVAVNDFLNSMR